MDLPSLLMAGSLDTLTSYFSVAFLVIFLPVSVVVYAVIPQRARKYFLLIASFCFLLADKRSVDCLFMPDNNGRPLFRLVA